MANVLKIPLGNRLKVRKSYSMHPEVVYKFNSILCLVSSLNYNFTVTVSLLLSELTQKY